MKENVGNVDRAVRAVLGPTLIVLGYQQLRGKRVAPLGLLAIVSGALLMETAITRVCPLNSAFGLDTRTDEERARDAGLSLLARP
jgi:hypothetical protein